MTDDLVFDDGKPVEVEVAIDEPPKSGEWIDAHDDVLSNLTEEEMAAGEFLGIAIDHDNDTDDGSQWGTIENPTMTREDFDGR